MTTKIGDLPPRTCTAEDLDRARRIGRDARTELSPAYIAVLRGLPEGARVAQAFALWRVARDALVRQGVRRGLAPDEARAEAARRMLALQDDSPT